MLSDEQKAHFRVLGFLKVPGALTPQEVASTPGDLTRSLKRVKRKVMNPTAVRAYFQMVTA
jgi:hypothetical protein